MPLLIIVRFFTTILSLVILVAAGYLLWRWYDGQIIVDPDGVARRVREEWPLWVGILLLAWSAFGGLLVKPLLAEGDKRPLVLKRSAGRLIQSPTGSELYVELHGDPKAQPIVLTHGWSMDSRIWGYAVEDLANRFFVVTWDLPGMGNSTGGISLEGFAADLQHVVEVTCEQPAVLVGHSIGGMTIQTLARIDPAFIDRRTSGLVLLNTTYTNPLKTMIAPRLWLALRRPLLEPMMWLMIGLSPLVWLSAWQSFLSGSAHLANRIAFGRHVTRSQLGAVSYLTTRNPPGAQARGNLAMFGWDATGAIARVDVPVLVIGGDIDIITKPDASVVIANTAKAGELHIEPDANHMGPVSNFGSYNAKIAAFATASRTRLNA